MGKLVWKKTIKPKLIKQAQRGMINGAKRMFNTSQRLAPFDDGELTLGARISSTGEGTDNFIVVISYGNDPVSAEYAVIQHENLVYNHRPPEQAKFLERAFIQEGPIVQYDVADTIKT